MADDSLYDAIRLGGYDASADHYVQRVLSVL